MNDRQRLLRRGLLLEVATVLWNLAEGVVAVTAGTLSGSVALIGFGIDSFVETASAVVVGWRLNAELRGRSAEASEHLERTASKIAGVLLLLLAAYVTIDAGRRLLGFGAEARESFLGILLTSVSLVVMPFLGWSKLRTARALSSRALRADAYETIACAWLSLTTLVGLALNASFGWWWADPLAALCLVPLIVREGLEGLRGEECGCGDDD
jgi:divalent metal cation (Fe/Co/Zn/Cd) transporter